MQSGKRVGQGSEEEASARWAVLVREVEKAAKQRSGLDAQLLSGSLVRGAPSVCWQSLTIPPHQMDIVFAHTFPRLDVEVSKHMNHLLKAPFCVHPKTGRVCVPIDPSIPHLFDPMVRAGAPIRRSSLTPLPVRPHRGASAERADRTLDGERRCGDAPRACLPLAFTSTR